jgi:hypothetical protein
LTPLSIFTLGFWELGIEDGPGVGSWISGRHALHH